MQRGCRALRRLVRHLRYGTVHQSAEEQDEQQTFDHASRQEPRRLAERMDPTTAKPVKGNPYGKRQRDERADKCESDEGVCHVLCAVVYQISLLGDGLGGEAGVHGGGRRLRRCA